MYFHRTRQVANRYKINVDELNIFYQEIQELPCKINEAGFIKDIYKKVKQFQKHAKDLFMTTELDIPNITRLIDMGENIDVELEEIPVLNQVITNK